MCFFLNRGYIPKRDLGTCYACDGCRRGGGVIWSLYFHDLLNVFRSESVKAWRRNATLRFFCELISAPGWAPYSVDRSFAGQRFSCFCYSPILFIKCHLKGVAVSVGGGCIIRDWPGIQTHYQVERTFDNAFVSCYCSCVGCGHQPLIATTLRI